ncbi:hypothetical protein [Streptococcus equinus]|uniref:hypothetical protein n=1 Tax=Streptococcus equinus TaxID=1335 RepID=UPI0015F61E13|nr:hypothetical protein [Streptococcus equinus]QMS96999.1 hypothetical protein H1R75_03755 [Streptococcus equinus]
MDTHHLLAEEYFDILGADSVYENLLSFYTEESVSLKDLKDDTQKTKRNLFML